VSHFEVGEEPFWAEHFWRKRTIFLSGMLTSDLLTPLNAKRIASWIVRLPHIRVFVSSLGQSDAPRSRLVPNNDAAVVFDKLSKSTLKFTVLMNRVDEIDEQVRAVRDEMHVPFHWRTDDIVVTYSSIGSGIGYHAGHEDAFIVQVSGQRHWRVWDAMEIDCEARRRILISAPDDIYPFVRSASPPVLECTLNPGDVLYVPPFFPHEGVTTKTSISLALGWRGVSYFHVLSAFPGLFSRSGSVDITSDGVFELLPDSTSSSLASIRESAELIISKLDGVGFPTNDRAALAARLQNVLRNSATSVS
jgi:50S ribosomal protein L16 3-hydroxylase